MRALPQRSLVLIASAAAVPAVWWSLLSPVGDASHSTPRIELAPAAGQSTAAASAPEFNKDAFHAQLWIAPTAPPPPPTPVVEAPPPPPPELRMELLAVMTPTDGGHAAYVYLPGADKTLLLRAGDEVEGYSVISVDAASLTVKPLRGEFPERRVQLVDAVAGSNEREGSRR